MREVHVLRRSFIVGMVLAATAPAIAQERSIVVASTTSTEQSGLFGHILPRFTAKTGIAVKVVALGTGQALEVGRRGDADVVFVHDKTAEEKFVAEGFALKRHEVMYNDFVIVGPKSDPAKAAGRDVHEALRRIAATKAAFVSRGDRSGTHAAELRYWKDAGVDLLTAVQGDWYKEVGQGMGPALNTGSAANGYVLTDRGTWLAFKNRGDLAIVSFR
jgi:tungstate transport system substrate-binding protein